MFGRGATADRANDAAVVVGGEREFIVRQVELPAARAADFRKLESAILRDEKGTAVLKKQ